MSYRVNYELYHDDNTRVNKTKGFDTLKEIYDWLQSMDETNKPSLSYYDNGIGGYGDIHMHISNAYYDMMFIRVIWNQEGVVFANCPTYKSHVAKVIREWIDKCNKEQKERKVVYVD